MRTVQIGGDRVSAIGLGAWQFGAREWGWKTSQRAEAIRIVHRALELGINLIDTAEAYARGESESIIGEALAGKREKAFLASKMLPIFPVPGRIRHAAAGSLQRLQTDRMNLYQVHWPNPMVPLRFQMQGMRAVRDAGQTTHVGVSNFTLGMWKRAERALGGPVMTNQVHYSLLRRKAEKRLLPWAQANGRVVIAYSPLAQGLLSGKYTPANAPSDVRKLNLLFARSNIEAAQPVLTALRDIAKEHNATCAQIALAWLVHHRNVIVIPGAKSVSQLEQNAAAGKIELSEGEFTWLGETSAAFRKAGLKAVPQFIGRLARS